MGARERNRQDKNVQEYQRMAQSRLERECLRKIFRAYFLMAPCEVLIFQRGRTPLESSRTQVVTQKRVGEVLLDSRKLKNYLRTSTLNSILSNYVSVTCRCIVRKVEQCRSSAAVSIYTAASDPIKP
jgi:hypothetical protein